MRGVISLRLAIGVCTATLMAFMPLFAGLRLGLSTTLIGILLAARTPISVIQSYTGHLADKWNRRSMVLWSGTAVVIAIALIPLTSGFWTLLIVYISVTLGQAFGIPAANAYIVNEGRTYGMGICMTMFMMAMQTGNSIGPLALGGIADWLGLDLAFYGAGFCMAIGLAVFALMVSDSSAKPASTNG
jgi:MFS family permease